MRTDSGGGTHDFVGYCTARRVQYSLSFSLTATAVEAVNAIPKDVWTLAHDADGDVREGAWVAELTGMLDLTAWLQTLGLHDHPARCWRPKTFRLQLFSIPARCTLRSPRPPSLIPPQLRHQPATHRTEPPQPRLTSPNSTFDHRKGHHSGPVELEPPR
ncbi:transposase [Nocardia arizonensis]|uniref:transposase n=1 Tax=Nocardia arizonensis TaxID=1141647 RepID=UPI000ADF565A